MLFIPTTQIMAADAQRRQFAAARLDGPTAVEKPRGSRGLSAALFHRRPQAGGFAGRRLNSARPAAS